MRVPAFAPTAATVALSAGQQYHIWTGHGSVVVVQSGRVALLEAPNWLAETMLSVRVDLQQGQHYPLQRSGWTCIVASRDAEFLIYNVATSAMQQSNRLLQLAASATQQLRSKTLRLVSLLSLR